MQTSSGRKFWPLDPRPEEIYIKDIASALSKLCRFGGHTIRFYSVAEHSILISQNVPKRHALWGLLHDASEAYIQDLIRPIKVSLLQYRVIEYQIMDKIIQKFNLSPLTMPFQVELADIKILNDEHKQAMKPGLKWYHSCKDPLGVNIRFWSSKTAEEIFLNEYNKFVNS